MLVTNRVTRYKLKQKMRQRIFGLIWPDGLGENSPANQKAQLVSLGIEPTRISIDPPAPRDGEIVTATVIDALGGEVVGVAETYAGLAKDGGGVEVIETDRVYLGLEGLVDLLRDWFKLRRRRQTDAARSAQRGRRKGAIPLWVRRLTPDEKATFCHLYQNQLKTDEELGRIFKVSRQSVWRAAKAMKLERIPLDD